MLRSKLSRIKVKDKSSIFIGIDGGGTKTRAVAIDYEGKQIYETVGGPGNVASHQALMQPSRT